MFVLLVLLMVDIENVLACWYEMVDVIKVYGFEP